MLLETIRRQRPVCVLFEGVGLLQAVEAVRAEFPGLRLIVDFHNVESRLLADVLRARLPRPLRPLTPLVWARRLAAARQADRRIARLAGEIWTCSTRDHDHARALGIEVPVSVIANPVPQWCLETRGKPLAPAQDILFVGHLRYPPNRRAVLELCQSIMPRLQQRLPGARLHVCGRSPKAKLKRLVESRGHRLTENPPELRPVYETAQVAAMPLREGGGTRIKVLEALAVGCPVVATGKAVEGLGLEDGVHFLKADDAREFAVALEAVMTTPALARRLAEAGRHLVERQFGPATRRAAISAALGPKWHEAAGAP